MELIRVGTWTCERSTRDWMKASSDGSAGWRGSRVVESAGGVAGGVGGRCLFVKAGCCSHRMTFEATIAR